MSIKFFTFSLSAFIALVFMGTASIILAQNSPWTTKTDIPTARYGLSTSMVNNNIYVIGGSDGRDQPALTTVEAYDPLTDSWTSRADMPTGRFLLSTIAVNGIIYAIGGAPSEPGGSAPPTTATVEAYDPATNTWTTKANMLTTRWGLSTSAVNGIIYAIGGNRNNSISTVEAYNPVTNTWTTKAPMPTDRSGLSTIVVNGKIYAIGGQNGSGTLNTVEVYDPATDTWTTKPDMPNKRVWVSTSLVNGIIYLIGGQVIRRSNYDLVEAYDPATDIWTPGTNMPTARWALSGTAVNERIYVFGGMIPVWAPSPKVEEYYPQNDLFGLVENVNVDRSYAIPGIDSVLITTKMSDPTGITLFADFVTPDQTPVDSVELFDDGNHNDGGAGDSLFANSWLVPPVEESNYYIDLQVTRVDTNTVVHYLNNMALFTTIGPLVVVDYVITSNDTIPNPGDQIRFKLELLNNGLTETAVNIEAVISTTDSSISEISKNNTILGDIPAGESVIPASGFQQYTVEINPNSPGNIDVWFNVDIYSEDNFFWSDSFAFHIDSTVTAIAGEENFIPDKYALHQNYPNPFNPSTTIEFSVPVNSNVTLTIYNSLGQVVTTLVNEEISAGNYSVIWNGTDKNGLQVSSGVYLYKMRANGNNGNNYSETKKMILLK